MASVVAPSSSFLAEKAHVAVSPPRRATGRRPLHVFAALDSSAHSSVDPSCLSKGLRELLLRLLRKLLLRLLRAPPSSDTRAMSFAIAIKFLHYPYRYPYFLVDKEDKRRSAPYPQAPRQPRAQLPFQSSVQHRGLVAVMPPQHKPSTTGAAEASMTMAANAFEIPGDHAEAWDREENVWA